MILLPALTMQLWRKLETLVAQAATNPDELPVEFRSEISHDEGIHLPDYCVCQQGTPVYLPVRYR